jgi:hypothetical protein
MRLIKSTPSSPKGGTHHARYGTQRGKHDAKQGQAQLPYGLFLYARWLFFWGELPRILLPRTLVNKSDITLSALTIHRSCIASVYGGPSEV